MSSRGPNNTSHFHSGSHSHYTPSVSPYHGSPSSPDAQNTLDIPAVRSQSREDRRHSSRPQQSASVQQVSHSPSSTDHFPFTHHPPPAPLSSPEPPIHDRARSIGGDPSEYSEWTSMRGTESDHYGTPSSATTSTISPSSLASPSLSHGPHTFSQKKNIVLPHPPIQTLADESQPSSPPSLSPIILSSPIDHFAPDATPDIDPSTTYSFVALPPGTHAKKRPRRRHDEIERLYPCTYQHCNKAYGTLNHLNAHINMQKHGAKRDPSEFREMRKILKANKDKKDGNASDTQSTLATNTPSASSTPGLPESSSTQPQQLSDVGDAGLLRGITVSPDSKAHPGTEVGISRGGGNANTGVSVGKRRPELRRLQIPSLLPSVPHPQTASHGWRPSFHAPTATVAGPYSAPTYPTRHPWPGRNFSGPASSISGYSSDEIKDEESLSPGMYFPPPSDVNHPVQSGSAYDQHRLPSPHPAADSTNVNAGEESLCPIPLHRPQPRSYSMNTGNSSSYHHHPLPPPLMQEQQRESSEVIYQPVPQRLPLHQSGAGLMTHSHSHSTGHATSPSYAASASDRPAGPSTSSSSHPFAQRDEQHHQSYSYQDLRGGGGNSDAYSSQHQFGNSLVYRQQQQPQQGTVAENQSHVYNDRLASGLVGGHHDHEVRHQYRHPSSMPSPERHGIEMMDVRPRHSLPSSGYSALSNAMSGPVPPRGPMDPNSTLLTPLNSGHPTGDPRSLFSSPGSSSRHS